MEACGKYDELISALVDGELSAEEESELRAHLVDCASCKAVYQAFSDLSEVIFDPLIVPPASLAQGVMFRVSIEAQKKKKPGRSRLVSLGAVAACLALILAGASRAGLLDQLNLGTGKSAAPEQAMLARELPDGQEEPPLEDQILLAEPEQAPNNSGTAETAEPPAAPPAEPEEGGQEESALFFGFSAQNADGGTAEATGSDESKEPAFLFTAAELTVYAGKFNAAEADKNKLLFTAATDEDKAAVYELVTALSDRAVTYAAEDAANLKTDPSYSIVVPANTAANKNAKNKLISVWITDKGVWCMVTDADGQGTETERTVYKAVGDLTGFEELLARLNAGA